MISMFKNGGSNFSFSRIAAFVIILIGMGLGIGAVTSGLNGEPVVINNQVIMKDVLLEGATEALKVPVRQVAWDALGEFWYNLCLGTAMLVTALYGVNKAAAVAEKFAEKRNQ